MAASLFALQTDDRENSFQVSRGEAFYIQVSVIASLKYNVNLHHIQIQIMALFWVFKSCNGLCLFRLYKHFVHLTVNTLSLIIKSSQLMLNGEVISVVKSYGTETNIGGV